MIPLECYTNLDGLAVLDSNDWTVLCFIKCHNIFKNLFFLTQLASESADFFDENASVSIH